ncbi:MAG: hypothetical protein RL385_625 [Pseudomonadota bacterium]|jgi:GT2 family glycosyltransferase
MTLVSIIIVNWNAGELLESAVRSIKRECLAPHEIVVVDNASVDASTERVAHVSGLRVLRNEVNVGFARACNQGAKAALGDYLLFFNPDCELVTDAVSACVRELERDARVGVCGVQLLNRTGNVWRSCQRFPTFAVLFGILSGLGRVFPAIPRDHYMAEWPHDADRDVDNVIGAFYFIGRSLFDRMGGFDETFFVYWEDVDLSRRVVSAGKRVRYLAGPKTYHLGGGTTDGVRAFRTFLSARGRILYAFKHLSGPAAWMHFALTLLLEPVARASERLARGRLKEAGQALAAARLLYADIPSLWSAIQRLSAAT